MNKNRKSMNVEERILQLEKKVSSPAGTTLNRIFSEEGLEWSLGLGQLQAPKRYYTGKTIEECLEKAEKNFPQSFSFSLKEKEKLLIKSV